MAKRPHAEVDEDLIRGMVGSAEPVMENKTGKSVTVEPEGNPAPEEVVEVHSGVTEPDDPETAGKQIPRETAKSSKRRAEHKNYPALFLQKKPGEPRRQTYISARVYDKIMDYLPVVAGQFSITNYLDNILCHHLEQFGDEINDLYDKNYRKPF